MKDKVRQVQVRQIGVGLMVLAFLIILALTALTLAKIDTFSRDTRGWVVTGMMFCGLIGKLLEQQPPGQRLFRLRGRQ